MADHLKEVSRASLQMIEGSVKVGVFRRVRFILGVGVGVGVVVVVVVVVLQPHLTGAGQSKELALFSRS